MEQLFRESPADARLHPSRYLGRHNAMVRDRVLMEDSIATMHINPTGASGAPSRPTGAALRDG